MTPNALERFFFEEAYYLIKNRVEAGLPIQPKRYSDSMRSSKRKRWRSLVVGAPCYWCGVTTDNSNATIEHIIPLALGGTSADTNLAPACFCCNQKRGVIHQRAIRLAYLWGKDFEWKYKP